ncbi:FxDxF family PEP-CTERM protein [Aeromonas simiae]|nr:FxDxF family PEP-CTERM protein [Aeromonas simiae]
MLRNIFLLLVLLGAGQAMAAVQDVSVPGAATTLFDHAGEAFGSHFTDTWQINVDKAAVANSGVVSFTFSDIFGVGNFSLAVWDVVKSSYVAITPVVNSLDAAWQFVLPDAGRYDLLISGVVTGTQLGGSYIAGIVTAPIPEPEVYALIGVGLLTLLVSKRRRSQRIPTLQAA